MPEVVFGVGTTVAYFQESGIAPVAKAVSTSAVKTSRREFVLDLNKGKDRAFGTTSGTVLKNQKSLKNSAEEEGTTAGMIGIALDENLSEYE